MGAQSHHSFCRFCHAGCAIEVEVDSDSHAVLGVRGVKADPMYEGFTCIKGRHLGQQHANEQRLLASVRQRDGRSETIATSTALDEIATQLADLIERHGPRTVATYCGTAAYQNATVLPIAKAFHQAIGSPSFYTSSTIDQPSKFVAPLRHGSWGAGTHTFDTADVVMIIGMNTVVSHYGWPGTIPCFNPLTSLQRAKQRGTRLIVIDPRRTEVAAHADIHLAVRPGEDPTLLAGIIRVLIDDDLIDHEFVDRHVDGLAELAAAVRPFTADYVASRAGVSADDVVAAAHLFGGAGKRGTAGTGTGPNMAPHMSLTEHLANCLNTLCGRYNRAGDTVRNFGGALAPLAAPKAQVFPAKPEVLKAGAASRIRDVHSVRGEAMTATLSDEILTPGEGQVTALLTIGGNPVVAWPDREKTVEALRALSLHVAVDAQVSATAKLAHYVLASTLSLERPDVPTTIDRWFETAYATYTPAILPRPGDTITESEVYVELASRLGVTISFPGGSIEPGSKVTADDVLDLIYAKGKVSLADLRERYAAAQRGELDTPAILLPELAQVVQEGDAGATARFQLTPDGIVAELADVLAEGTGAAIIDGFDDAQFPFRLSSRRLLSVFNSSGREIDALREKAGTSYAHVHPDDLVALGIADGSYVEISSPRGSVRTLVKAAPDVRRGAISMAHAWGGLPDDVSAANADSFGDTTAALIDAASGYDPFTAMPVQSAIPVRLAAVG
jgi:anaerobic selenocysteine-containing dehydrogenase